MLGSYRNGTNEILIYEDGTKIRIEPDEGGCPEKPESLDYKITNRCTGTNCAFCHERSGPDGKHGDIMNDKFIDTLLPYTELAVGGGNVLEHPDFVPFLRKCKEKKLICNATFNQYHFSKPENLELIKSLAKEKLLYGIGVSLTPSEAKADELVRILEDFPTDNVVVHVINGIHSKKILERLYDKGIKILILGYKTFGRGEGYYESHGEGIESVKSDIHDDLAELVKHFKAVSFDNLAISQLDVKRLFSDEEWNEFYMGHEGEYTMYVDSVYQQYAVSSTSPIRYHMLDDIAPMFAKIRESCGFSKYEGKGE